MFVVVDFLLFISSNVLQVGNGLLFHDSLIFAHTIGDHTAKYVVYKIQDIQRTCFQHKMLSAHRSGDLFADFIYHFHNNNTQPGYKVTLPTCLATCAWLLVELVLAASGLVAWMMGGALFGTNGKLKDSLLFIPIKCPTPPHLCK